MKYWKELTDSHIRFANTDIFQAYPVINGKINANGYVDAPLGTNDVIYMGTCDIMSSILAPENRWVELLHKARHKSIPLMTIGSTAAGLPSMVRRLHSYISQYGPPKTVYMSIARFEGYEYVNKSGNCYNVNSRVGTPQYLMKRELLSQEEFDIWIKQVETFKGLYNIHNNKYILEERFAFIETICDAYNIELKWTFNPSDACIVVLHRNIDLFEDISDFMKKSFVGLVEISDQLHDRSIGSRTHQRIYEQFVNPTSWNFEQLKETAFINYAWLEEKFGNDLIKNES